MIRAAVIGNPRSHGYQRHAAADHPGVTLAEPATPAELVQALCRFNEAGVDLLVVDGGDGTLREVLSALPLSYPAAPPQIALVRAGNTNLAARALGGIGRSAAALHRLLAAASAGQLRSLSCPVLRIDWAGEPDRPALHGLLFGAAGFAAGKRIADAEIHRRGAYSRHAVALTIILTFLRSMRQGGPLRRGTPMMVEVDEQASPGPHFLFLATTLPRLTLGLWPFWGAGEGGLRWLDIDAPPARLGRAVLAALLRRPRSWMQAQGYRSGRAQRIHLSMADQFVLDGEFFAPGAAGIVLSCPGSITFVRP